MGPVKFVVLCFVIFAAFGAGYYYQGISDAEPFLAYAKTPSALEECEVPEPAVASAEDYCAILTMPKALVPFLERLQRNKLAKDVVITPASLRNENGRITAVARVAPGAETSTGRPAPAQRESKKALADRADTSVLGALAVYFLAGSKKNETH